MALTGDTRNVSWSDFMQVVRRPNGLNEDAEIHVQFPYKYSTGRAKGAIAVTAVELKISTIPDKCWVVTKKMTNDLLEHEQGHYDITVIGAKEFYNILTGLSAKNEHDLNKQIQKESDTIQRKINETNKRYDAQTNHSQNKLVQQTWHQKIVAEKQKPAGNLNNLPQ